MSSGVLASCCPLAGPAHAEWVGPQAGAPCPAGTQAQGLRHTRVQRWPGLCASLIPSRSPRVLAVPAWLLHTVAEPVCSFNAEPTHAPSRLRAGASRVAVSAPLDRPRRSRRRPERRAPGTLGHLCHGKTHKPRRSLFPSAFNLSITLCPDHLRLVSDLCPHPSAAAPIFPPQPQPLTTTDRLFLLAL